ncbi:MAG: recombinase family protein [Selenomonadaceae bacterium]|nr:recombinase family protein [Selenomonadaceae bacterium]
MSKTYGYVRVSTQEQHTDRQIAAMLKAGVLAENIFSDKLSGKNFDRPNYKRMMEALRPGDRLIIASIDRLGRDCYETIDQWRIITCKKMVQIIVMDMDFLEDLQTKDVFGRMLGDIMLYIMSYFAQLEREKIITRQKEGIAAAKARGVKFGRKAIGKPRKFDAILKQWRAKEITTTKAARLLGVSRPTFLKWTKK